MLPTSCLPVCFRERSRPSWRSSPRRSRRESRYKLAEIEQHHSVRVMHPMRMLPVIVASYIVVYVAVLSGFFLSEHTHLCLLSICGHLSYIRIYPHCSVSRQLPQSLQNSLNIAVDCYLLPIHAIKLTTPQATCGRRATAKVTSRPRSLAMSSRLWKLGRTPAKH